MSPRPTDAGNFAEAVYAQMAPIADQDADYNFPLLIFLGALGQMFEQADQLAHVVAESWTTLLDIDQIPDEGLPWFGQFIGVNVDLSLSVNDQRQQIRSHEGWGRGRPKVVKDSIRKFLSGTQTVVIIERDTSPYHFSVMTYATETPAAQTYQDLLSNYGTYEIFRDSFGTYYDYIALDPRFEITATLDAKKPAGNQYTFTVHAGAPGVFQEYEQLLIDFTTYQELLDANQTYSNVYISP